MKTTYNPHCWNNCDEIRKHHNKMIIADIFLAILMIVCILIPFLRIYTIHQTKMNLFEFINYKEQQAEYQKTFDNKMLEMDQAIRK